MTTDLVPKLLTCLEDCVPSNQVNAVVRLRCQLQLKQKKTNICHCTLHWLADLMPPACEMEQQRCMHVCRFCVCS